MSSGFKKLEAQQQTCTVMDEVFDEVPNDGIKNRQHNEDGYKQVEDIGRQVDSIPRRGYVRFKEHGPIFLLVMNV